MIWLRYETIIDMADSLHEAAKKAAATQGTTLKALVELGVRQVLEARKRGGEFRLRKASFGGEVLQPVSRLLPRRRSGHSHTASVARDRLDANILMYAHHKDSDCCDAPGLRRGF